jgi:hypothetical protein
MYFIIEMRFEPSRSPHQASPPRRRNENSPISPFIILAVKGGTPANIVTPTGNVFDLIQKNKKGMKVMPQR